MDNLGDLKEDLEGGSWMDGFMMLIPPTQPHNHIEPFKILLRTRFGSLVPLHNTKKSSVPGLMINNNVWNCPQNKKKLVVGPEDSES